MHRAYFFENLFYNDLNNVTFLPLQNFQSHRSNDSSRKSIVVTFWANATVVYAAHLSFRPNTRRLDSASRESGRSPRPDRTQPVDAQSDTRMSRPQG